MARNLFFPQSHSNFVSTAPAKKSDQLCHRIVSFNVWAIKKTISRGLFLKKCPIKLKQMILPKGENVAHTGCFTQTATKEIDTVSDLNEPAEKRK